MAVKKVADIQDDYSEEISPVEWIIIIVLFLVAMAGVLALVFGQ